MKLALLRRALVLVLLLGGVVAATGGGATRHLFFKVSFIEEATSGHPHPPAGDPGDTFSTTLRLSAMGKALGFPDGTPMGTMSFTWGPLNGSCSTAAHGCSGTTNIVTLTRLPGGTITAGGKNVSLSKGIVVPVISGTGIFNEVKATIKIAPDDVAIEDFSLVLG